MWNRRSKNPISMLETEWRRNLSGVRSTRKGKEERQRHRIKIQKSSENCIHWTTKGHCDKVDSCSFKHYPDKRHEGECRHRSSSPSRSPRRNSLERRRCTSCRHKSCKKSAYTSIHHFPERRLPERSRL